jgi:hypothetical protein
VIEIRKATGLPLSSSAAGLVQTVTRKAVT